MNMVYAYTELSRWDFGAFRLLGPGLGNLLFPWARAIVASKEHGLKLIWPTWPQFKIGPVLRRESDSRFYSGLFRNPGNYIDGGRKLWLIATGQRVSEKTWSSPLHGVRARRPAIVCFLGLEGLFEPLMDFREDIENELLRMTCPEHLQGLSHDFRRSITVHIRRGDFRPFDDHRMRAGDFNIQLSLAWVADTIRVLREGVGEDWPVWLFSDGSDAELQEILDLPSVQRLSFGSAFADLIAMSRSNVLVVSSTFSMWPAFLGAVPSIYYPGQLRQRLLPRQCGEEIEREPGTRFRKHFLDSVYRKAGEMQ